MRNYIKFIFTSLFALSSFFLSFGQDKGTLVEEIVAVVGDEIILKSELDLRIGELKNQGINVDFAAECAILEELLYEKLLVNQAKVDSLEVTEDQVNEQLDRRIDYFISQFPSKEEFEEFYGKTSAQLKEDFRQDVKDQILIQQIQAEITRNVNITPKEVETFYNGVPRDSLPLIQSEVQYSQIVMKPSLSEEQTQITIDKLNQHRTDLLENPFKFGLYAIRFSEDQGSANSTNQGCYRGVERGVMVSEFEEAVLNLEPGQITEPFKTDFGWHIARLESKSGKYYDVCHILNTVEPLEIDIQVAQHKLDTLKNSIETNDSLTFFLAATKYSQDKDTRAAGGQVPNQYTGGTKHELSKLDPQTTLILNQLKPGEVSAPVQFTSPSGQKEYRIFILTSRSDAHVANLSSDYALLKRMTESEAQNEALEKWIKEKLKSTHRRLIDSYQNGIFRYDWVSI